MDELGVVRLVLFPTLLRAITPHQTAGRAYFLFTTALTKGEGVEGTDAGAEATVRRTGRRRARDELLLPTVIEKEDGKPVACISINICCIFQLPS